MWLETLTLLIERERTGTRGDREAEQLIHEWMDERAKIRYVKGYIRGLW